MLGEKRLDYEWLPRALKRLSSAEIMALEIMSLEINALEIRALEIKALQKLESVFCRGSSF
jgi:hypothetical protein